ncbi:uncharacterized protein B0J16DRAFT_318040 [Fusarium flagelliforme]|uniref:uncharacterized protein n=1 Tax=Fusarium flagelliforme TaxID=2675880 RepID=UPI001E8D4C30|nr:uncharacterized protein B0J16DRAFT_318040 [Fusarium flagelliforme]KAH7188373.1 hypothetical protein B0J16DRAFT_318040 [Fusarium flagelliforme]
MVWLALKGPGFGSALRLRLALPFGLSGPSINGSVPYVAGSKGPPSLQKVPRDWGLTSPQNRTRKLQHTAPPSSASAASKERLPDYSCSPGHGDSNCRAQSRIP